MLEFTAGDVLSLPATTVTSALTSHTYAIVFIAYFYSLLILKSYTANTDSRQRLNQDGGQIRFIGHRSFWHTTLAGISNRSCWSQKMQKALSKPEFLHYFGAIAESHRSEAPGFAGFFRCSQIGAVIAYNLRRNAGDREYEQRIPE